MVPSGSEEPALEKLTVSGAIPLAGEAVGVATGFWFPLAMTVPVI